MEVGKRYVSYAKDYPHSRIFDLSPEDVITNLPHMPVSMVKAPSAYESGIKLYEDISEILVKKNSSSSSDDKTQDRKPEDIKKEPSQKKEKEPPKRQPSDEPQKEVPEVTKEETPKPFQSSQLSLSSGPTPAGSGGGNNGDNNNNNDNDDESKDPVQPAPESSASSYPPLLAIPMKDKMPLPGRAFSINVTDPAVQDALLEICARSQPHFVMFHVRDPDAPDTDVIHSQSSVYLIGVHCHIQKHVKEGENMRILGYALERCRMDKLLTAEEQKQDEEDESFGEDFPTAYLKDSGVSFGLVSVCKDLSFDLKSPTMTALREEVSDLMKQLAISIPSKKETSSVAAQLINSPDKLADFLGSITAALPKSIQELLEEFNIEERLRKALSLFKTEYEAFKLADQTMRELSLKSDEAQTKILVKEFIKNLKKNAGLAGNAEGGKAGKFDERLKHLKLSEEAMEAYNSEKEKMESQNEHLTEIGVSERYLDWLTSIPWGVYSKDRFNLKVAREILDRDHYGLKDVKDHILEFIARGKISGKVDGKILCFAGPPGTGKTSIAKSIAEALGRRYVRIAMGGIQDVHEVKGHRRTYIGSIPGRIIYALKSAKTSNPLLLIDEIDKLDLSKGGGAASAFLEILDPEQNHEFVDNYIDVKVDLSKVMFVCTANYLGNIPGPLRDRMDVIDVSGYTTNEKIEIAQRHLIPQGAKKSGLDESHVHITKETVARLIEKYCRESGLRNVKKLINRIFSKASLKIVEDLESKNPEEDKAADATVASLLETSTEESPEEKKDAAEEKIGFEEVLDVKPLDIPPEEKLEITPENLKDFVGPEIYTNSRVYDQPPPGVATGLSFNSSGNGGALYIESILTNSIASGTGHAGMHVTGHLRDVMKESAQIAYSYAKSFMVKNYAENRFFEAADVHVHCPDGAIPKDGPSAGIAFTSSLVSLALNEPLPPNVAMTGELTLTGKVSAVGGLREKILGAKRYGCDTVIFPKDIENELEEIPVEVKEGVTFIPVLWYDEVFKAIYPDSNAEKFNSVWKAEFAKLDEKKKKK